MNEKGRKLIKNNLQKIIIIVVSVLYILQGFFTLKPKGVTILEVLGSIAINVFFGVIISNLFNSMGLKEGRESEQFIASMKTYGETKQKATPYFDKLQDWCDVKNEVELETAKKDIIREAGLKWDLYKDGYYINNPPTDKDAIMALKSANNCKIERLTARELLSDLPSQKYMKRRFGEGEREYSVKKGIEDLATRVLIGIAMGMYGLYPLITSENATEKLANLLWNSFQIALWLAFGLLKYMSSKSFMENEYRQTHIIQKTEYLNEFIIYCTKENTKNG